MYVCIKFKYEHVLLLECYAYCTLVSVCYSRSINTYYCTICVNNLFLF